MTWMTDAFDSRRKGVSWIPPAKLARGRRRRRRKTSVLTAPYEGAKMGLLATSWCDVTLVT
jgi:hypothetical protein